MGCQNRYGALKMGAEMHVPLLVCAFQEEMVWGWVHKRGGPGGVLKSGFGVS